VWGETRGQTELGVLAGGGWGWTPGGPGGQGAPRENRSIPGDGAWECCWEDAHDCFKVALVLLTSLASAGRSRSRLRAEGATRVLGVVVVGGGA